MAAGETQFARNVLLTLSYEGTSYCGWQIQPNGLSIQECVERGLEKLTGQRPTVLCAGRTDSGVHAIGQAASFRTNSRIPADQIRRGLQSCLPFDIVVTAAQDVADNFHATWSAIRKTYRYVIYDGEICPPFLRHLVCRSRRCLDEQAMHEAAQSLLGRQDFRCFESHYPNKRTSVRTIERVQVKRTPLWAPWQAANANGTGREDSSLCHASAAVVRADCLEQHQTNHVSRVDQGTVIVLEITADGFLYNMVRAIAGTLLRIGEGKRDVGDVARVIASLDRAAAGMTAPASGLYLVSVEYPRDLLKAESGNPPSRKEEDGQAEGGTSRQERDGASSESPGSRTASE